VIRRGLTVPQTALFVTELLAATTPQAEQAVLTRWSDGPLPAGSHGVRPSRSVVETIALDLTAIRRSAGRLESCLVTTPLAALDPGTAGLIRESLKDLGGVLRALAHTIAGALTHGSSVEVP